MRQLDPSKCASMKEFIDKVQVLHQEIMHAGKQISSEDMAILLLMKLPAKYSAFYSSLITSGRMTALTWEELVPMVLDQEDRFKVTSPKSDSTALTTQAKSKKKGKKSDASSSSSGKQSNASKKLDITCHGCREKGHIKKDCPQKDDKSKKEPTSSPTAVQAWGNSPHVSREGGLDRLFSYEGGGSPR